MQIDLSSFRKALDGLDKGLARTEAAMDDELLRDGAIQRFEYSYELAWKSMRRVLEAEAAYPEEVDALPFRDVIRLGAEKGIIENPEDWFSFREERNISSHTYDEAKAAAVYAMARRFAPAARILLARLEVRPACLP
jgi:nucleotidyltransferase substrate binding protein (TIGR01987 family)